MVPADVEPPKQEQPVAIGAASAISKSTITLSAEAQRIGAVTEVKVADASVPTQTVNLGAKLNEVGSIDEAHGRAKIFNLYADTWSRIGMVVVISIIFIGLNYKVMSFIDEAFKADIDLIKSKSGFNLSDRLVNAQVIMGLIGATVVQVGVTVIAIVSYLFPKAKTGD